MGNNGPIIQATCTCGTISQIRKYSYNSNIKKWGSYKCRDCAIIEAGAKGSYNRSHTRDLSQSAKEMWAINEYAGKVATGVSSSWTDNRKEAHADMMRAKWRNDDYRSKMVKIAKELWLDEKYIAARLKERGEISKPQAMLYQLLDDNNITYFPEGPETLYGPWLFDCKITTPHVNILVEVQSYFHTLPEQSRRDRAKFAYIEKYFPDHKLIYIWEHEFYAKDNCIDRLLTLVGKSVKTEDFYFRDVRIGDISSKDAKEFLNLYHYIGKSRGGKIIGAHIGDKLIACGVLSSLVRQNISHQFDGGALELSRLCVHPSYHKKNFASWFIAKMLKQIRADIIVAYADTTVGHTGTIYKAAGFKLHHEVPADYWYMDNGGWVMHKKTLYSRAKQMHMSENEFAEEFGYIKKWGGKKLCFTKQNK